MPSSSSVTLQTKDHTGSVPTWSWHSYCQLAARSEAEGREYLSIHTGRLITGLSNNQHCSCYRLGALAGYLNCYRRSNGLNANSISTNTSRETRLHRSNRTFSIGGFRCSYIRFREWPKPPEDRHLQITRPSAG